MGNLGADIIESYQVMKTSSLLEGEASRSPIELYFGLTSESLAYRSWLCRLRRGYEWPKVDSAPHPSERAWGCGWHGDAGGTGCASHLRNVLELVVQHHGFSSCWMSVYPCNWMGLSMCKGPLTVGSVGSLECRTSLSHTVPNPVIFSPLQCLALQHIAYVAAPILRTCQ